MPQQPLDISQLMLVLACYKTGGATGCLHPSRTTDTMHIIFRAIGKIEIDHVADIRDIDPPGGNIRRHQHTECSASETFQCGTPLRQTPVSMQHSHSMALTTQEAPQPIGTVLRPGEDQRSRLISSQ
jgi:hypothetical protein